MKGGCILVIPILSVFVSCSHKINPDRPSLGATNFRLDSLPISEINVPIQINLRPIFTMAESQVDTLFTSLNYPDGWVQQGCDTRYKYIFRRSPLQMKASGTSLNLGFLGYYKIIGSTRVCVGGAAVSPWTAPCRCGFNEPERRVNVSFTNSISIQPDYKVKLLIKRNEPQPLDKCEVCFWGQDITQEVMNGLKEELDTAKAVLERSYGTIDLKPQFQEVWNRLNKAYSLYEMGWLQINPQKIRINNIYAKGDSLFVYLGLSARAVVSFSPETVQEFTVQSSAYSAEYGTTGGGVINITTKSGANDFFGTALWYHRNPATNAQTSCTWSSARCGPIGRLRISAHNRSAGDTDTGASAAYGA